MVNLRLTVKRMFACNVNISSNAPGGGSEFSVSPSSTTAKIWMKASKRAHNAPAVSIF